MNAEDVLRRGYEYFNAHGRPDEDAFAPDVVLVEADALPVGGRTYRGYEGVLEALGQLEDAFEEVRFEPLEFVPRDDRMLVHLRMRCQGRGSGVPVVGQFSHLFTLRDDGLITRWEVHVGRRSAELALAEG